MSFAVNQFGANPYYAPPRLINDVGSDILTKLGDGLSYAIPNIRVSNASLEALSHRPDLCIKEINAPLSTIDVPTLLNFLAVHGQNIEKFNLQNASHIDNKSFIEMMNYMPNLQALSLQYQHELTNDTVLQAIENHPKLDTLLLSLNRRLNKHLFFELLKKNRVFKKVSLDLNPTTQPSNIEYIAAKINHLALIGLSFQNNDVSLCRKITTLQNLKLVLTSIDAEHIAKLMDSLDRFSDIEVVVSNHSEILTRKLFSDLTRQHVEGLKITKLTKTSLKLSWN